MELFYTASRLFFAARNGYCPELKTNPTRGWHGHNFRISASLCDADTSNSKAENNNSKAEKTIKTQLNEKLDQLHSRLHCSLLNESCSISEPSDPNLLDFLSSLPETADFHSLSLESTPNSICRKTPKGTIISFGQELEAAHFLPMVPKGHKCSRLHGHRFFVSIECLCNNKISDYFHLTEAFSPLMQKLNGCLLNELPGLQNPSSENLSRYIFENLHSELPELLSVTVFETRTAGSSYYGQNKWDCFKDFEFDSAVPSEKNFTGHTYFVRLNIQGQTDEKAGWILDFAKIKEYFKPHYKELDHQLLSEIAGQDLSSLKQLSNWIFQKLQPEIPLLHSVTIKENDSFAVCLKKNS